MLCGTLLYRQNVTKREHAIGQIDIYWLLIVQPVDTILLVAQLSKNI